MTDEQHSTALDRMLLPVEAIVQHVISRLDINAILEQIDVNELVQRVDLEAVMEQSVRRATRKTLDLARAVGRDLDVRATVAVDRVLRRPAGWRRLGPGPDPVIDAE